MCGCVWTSQLQPKASVRSEQGRSGPSRNNCEFSTLNDTRDCADTGRLHHVEPKTSCCLLVLSTLPVQVGGTLARAWPGVQVGPHVGRGRPVVAVPVPLLVGQYYPVVATATGSKYWHRHSPAGISDSLSNSSAHVALAACQWPGTGQVKGLVVRAQWSPRSPESRCHCQWTLWRLRVGPRRGLRASASE